VDDIYTLSAWRTRKCKRYSFISGLVPVNLPQAKVFGNVPNSDLLPRVQIASLETHLDDVCWRILPTRTVSDLGAMSGILGEKRRRGVSLKRQSRWPNLVEKRPATFWASR